MKDLKMLQTNRPNLSDVCNKCNKQVSMMTTHIVLRVDFKLLSDISSWLFGFYLTELLVVLPPLKI
jgi:hypothetical protein